MVDVVFNDFHLFSGSGGGAVGFSWARRQFGDMKGRFECIGGIDVSPNRCLDFEYLMARPASVMNLFSADDFIAFDGKYDKSGRMVQPGVLPAGWRDVTPADVRAAAGGRRPHVVFTSAPCKGFSGLLSNAASASQKYQALNRLTIRGVELALDAWEDDPFEFLVFENVPRIEQRGSELLDELIKLLVSRGYACHKDAHCCGELGGLGQRRKRFLLLARHIRKVRPFLYQPERQPLKTIGDIIEKLPLPEDPAGGPMHRLPRLKPLTLARLALIPAGRDWRALADVDPDAVRILPVGTLGAKFNNCYRIVAWGEPSPAITGGAGPSSGGLNVADPRPPPGGHGGAGKYKVTPMDESAGTVIAESATGNGAFATADFRLPASTAWRGDVMGVQTMGQPSGTVTGRSVPTTGAFSISDTRMAPAFGDHATKLQVDPMDEPARTVTGARVGSGALLVGDVRLGCSPNGAVLRVSPSSAPSPAVIGQQNPWSSGGFAVEELRLNTSPRNGTMGVQPWALPGATVTASLDVQAGPGAVEDVREPDTQWTSDYPVILSMDGTWHRPLSAWELAALQSFPLWVNERPLVFHGSATEWREAIGNAVPPLSAMAIAGALLDSLLWEAAGQTFMIGGGGIWVDPADRLGRPLGWVDEPQGSAWGLL